MLLRVAEGEWYRIGGTENKIWQQLKWAVRLLLTILPKGLEGKYAKHM